MFHALTHELVKVPGVQFRVEQDDIEGLNRRALGEASGPRLAVTKVSAAIAASLLDDYVLLRAGAALGRGVGPLVVTRKDATGASLADLSGKRVGIPGKRTTAYLLLGLFAPPDIVPVPMRFEQIIPRVASGELDAGLIIHESRFTYPEHGLRALADLGALWEEDTGLPLPLGVIAAQRQLGPALIRELEQAVAASVRHAFAHPSDSRTYIREHAQEMSEEVCQKHIALYVNDYSIDIGDEGRRAVDELFTRGAAVGILQRPTKRAWLD